MTPLMDGHGNGRPLDAASSKPTEDLVTRRLAEDLINKFMPVMNKVAAIFSSRIEAELYLAEFTEISEKLSLTFSKFSIHRATQGINMAGYRIWPTHMLLRKRSIRQFRRDIKWIKKRYTDPEEQEKQLVKRVNSFIAHAKHADTYRIRTKLINEAFK